MDPAVETAAAFDQFAFNKWLSELPYWWLSFVDPSLPEGSQFVGACIVQAVNPAHAILNTHALGINPGGEVAFVPFDGEEGRLLVGDEVFDANVNKLLSKADLESLGWV